MYAATSNHPKISQTAAEFLFPVRPGYLVAFLRPVKPVIAAEPLGEA